jgi:hypothetical protein
MRRNMGPISHSLPFGVSDDSGKRLWFDDLRDPQNDIAVLPLLPDQKVG